MNSSSDSTILMRRTQPLTGFEAFQKCIERAYPNGGTIWLKLSHNQFFTGEADPSGKFSIWATAGSHTNRKKTQFIPDAFSHIAALAQKQPGGVFYIPGRPTDFPLKDYCFEAADIGAEMDDGTAEEQWQRVEWFSAISGLEPGLVISSGGKSIHPHWFLDEPVPTVEATDLKKLLAIALLSDPAVANSPQPMRIAGFYRQERDREQSLDHWSDSRYTLKQFLQGLKLAFEAKGYIFPSELSDERWRRVRKTLTDKALTAEVKADRIRDILALDEAALYPQPRQYERPKDFHYNGDRIPLEICLTKDDRELIAHGIGEGSRSISGFKLAANLIATASHLDGRRISYQQDPRQLFDEFCARCSPALSSREAEAIWRSANRSNPTPSLSDDAIENCIGAWQARQNPESSKRRYQNGSGSPDPDLYERYLKQEALWEQIEESDAGHRKNEWFRGFCQKVKQRFFAAKTEKKKQQSASADAGKSAKKVVQFSPGEPLPSPEEYQALEEEPPLFRHAKSERRQALVSAYQAGWKVVIDRGQPGSGKSHDSGLLYPEMFSDGYDVDDCDSENRTPAKVWYLSPDHTNPTTRSVEQFANMAPRHRGMIVDSSRETPLGKPWLRHPTADDQYKQRTPANCEYANLFTTLANKGYDVNSEKVLITKEGRQKEVNPVCAGCQHKWHCHELPGHGYGFKFERMATMESARIRAHLSSLPTPGFFKGAYNYSDDVVIVEEAGASISAVKTVETNLSELAAEWSYVEQEAPEAFAELRDFRLALNHVLAGQANNDPRFGADHEAIAKFLPSVPENIHELIEQVHEALPTVAKLVEPPDSVTGLGGEYKKIGQYIRSKMRQEARGSFAEKVQQLPVSALVDALNIWAGSAGALRCNNGALSLTVPDSRAREILGSCKFVVLLDATADKKVLAKKLGIDPNQILEIEQEPQPLTNLCIINVNTPGLGSGHISDSAKQRVLALINHINEKHQTQSPVIALKRDREWLKEHQTGHWFADSRGSNVFQGEQVMISINTPRINVGAVQNEYLCLHGSLEGFDDYYLGLIQVEQEQCVAGRQRAGREPEKEFIHYTIGTAQNLDFLAERYGCTVKNVEAGELCPEAATKGEQSRLRIVQAATQLLDAGAKLTQTAIGELADMSQGAISKIANRFGSWKSLRKILLTLVGLYRGSNISGEKKHGEKHGPPPDLSALTEEERLWATEFLPRVAETLTGEDLADAVAQVSQMYDPETLQRIMHFTPHWVKTKLLVAMLCILPKWARDEFLATTGLEMIAT